MHIKARMFLLVDLREFFSDLGLGGGRKKSSENDQLTFFFPRKKNSKTSKVNLNL